MADSTPLERGEITARPEHIFPTLTPERVARVAAHARRRPLQAGERRLRGGKRIDRVSFVHQVLRE